MESVIGAERLTTLRRTAERFRKRLGDRVVWNVNSTATGGGVAEMLTTLIGYTQDLDVDVRWRVISGDASFFAITKRLHNRLHGYPGDGGPLGADESDHYAGVLAANIDQLLAEIRPGDIVVLHDPQTVGLTSALTRAGALVAWRCHIGADQQNEWSLGGWEFLRPYLVDARRFVFTRPAYIPPWVPASMATIIPPSIDPFSSKNQELDKATVQSIMSTIGILPGDSGQVPGRFVRADGSTGEVARRATIVAEELPGPDDPLLLQVSRWDRLKDMPGVMQGFAEHVAPHADGYLILAGPAVEGVTDDPEGAGVYAECVEHRQALPEPIRRRVMLATLPTDDVDENAVMVNAMQRHATVIIQKSLAEGFGLTVTEGMWKGRPVIGSAVGGIQDQLGGGAGVLLPDPADLAALGAEVRHLLGQPGLADRIGAAAHAQVRADYVGDVHMLRYARLFEELIEE